MTPAFRFATAADVPALKALIESAYRGEAARAGWTHEADLITGERIQPQELFATIAAPSQRVIVAEAAGALAGCVAISDLGAHKTYLGLLCVAPLLQAGGLGKALLAEGEGCAVRLFAAHVVEMTVVSRRTELIAWYERRGYALTGERRPFPLPANGPGLEMVVLAKRLMPGFAKFHRALPDAKTP